MSDLIIRTADRVNLPALRLIGLSQCWVVQCHTAGGGQDNTIIKATDTIDRYFITQLTGTTYGVINREATAADIPAHAGKPDICRHEYPLTLYCQVMYGKDLVISGEFLEST